MNDRLRRLLIIFGPIIGALLLFYFVNAAIGTYSVGVEELKHERRAEATAEAAHAITETTEITDTVATTDVNPIEVTSIDATEAITSIMPPSVTEAINLDAALTETVSMSETATMTDTETATDETATDEAASEEVTTTEEISATETVTE